MVVGEMWEEGVCVGGLERGARGEEGGGERGEEGRREERKGEVEGRRRRRGGTHDPFWRTPADGHCDPLSQDRATKNQTARKQNGKTSRWSGLQDARQRGVNIHFSDSREANVASETRLALVVFACKHGHEPSVMKPIKTGMTK